MGEEIKSLAQAFGSGAIGLIALIIFARYIRASLQEMFALLKITINALIQEQQHKERLFGLIEDKHTTTAMLLKSIEVIGRTYEYEYHRTRSETEQNLQTGARTTPGEAGSATRPE
jgi:hypothetical protein